MLRKIGGVIAALIVWAITVTVLNLGLRHGLPGYAAVEKAMTFTVQMMAARLGISFVATLLAGAVTAMIARDRSTWPLVTGIVMLLIFVPIHLGIWVHIPLWYHITFLTSLVVLSVVGGRMVRS